MLSRIACFQILRDAGIDPDFDIQIGAATTSQLQGLVRQVTGQQFSDWARRKFSAPARTKFGDLPAPPANDQPSRDQLLHSLAGLGIDVADPAVAGMTDEQLQALVNQVGGQAFAAKFAERTRAPASGADDMQRQFLSTTTTRPDQPDQPFDFAAAVKNRLAEVGAKITTRDRQHLSEAFRADRQSTAAAIVNAAIDTGRLRADDHDPWIKWLIAADGTHRFSAGGQSEFDQRVDDLEGRPAGRFGALDDPFVRDALERTHIGRKAMTAADSRRRTRKFSQAVDQDAFERRALAATSTGRRILATSDAA